MNTASDDGQAGGAFETFLNSKWVDGSLWVIAAISVAQLLWRLFADGELWLGPLLILLMSATSLTLRLRRRRKTQSIDAAK